MKLHSLERSVFDVVDALKDMEVESNRGDAAGAEGNLKNRVAGDTPAPSTE